ncbi:MAG TPA: winged helix-turn-helix domain-containing protein [Jiangellaceae bacterium]|nr:winged helix-turn-helix domain-containing protein [Jiangellaceae bacterium]
MRPRDPPLLPILRSRLVGDLLALLASDPQRWRTLDEIAARTGGAYPTVTREVRRLEQAGLIEVEVVGRSKRIRLNVANPLHAPLAELMVRAFGPVVVVGEEFGGLAGVDEVSIYGSWAARYLGQPGATPNDIDVLVLGEPDRDDIHAAARRAEKRLAVAVNTAIRRRDDWARADDSFARQVKASPRVIASAAGDR